MDSQNNQNQSNKTKQSRLLKFIGHDGYVVNDFNQSINIHDNPRSRSITSESSKNQFIQNNELQKHPIIHNNQNRGEIANNIGSFDFEEEMKKLLAVQKKYRDIHDQKEQEKPKISQQKGKCKVVDESEDEFQLNHFNPNGYKMFETQQSGSMVDKKDTKYRNDKKKNPPKIAKAKQYDSYQNQSSQEQYEHFGKAKKNPPKIAKAKQYDSYQNQSSQEQYEHFGKAKKNPLQPILANPTINTTNHQTNNVQINAVIRNDQAVESLCDRLCRAICFLQPVQRRNNRIYQDHNTSRQNLNTSRFDATNINDISQYSHRQIDSSRPLVNHRTSFELLDRQDPNKLPFQKKAKKDIGLC